jgi:hypothetical protein
VVSVVLAVIIVLYAALIVALPVVADAIVAPMKICIKRWVNKRATMYFSATHYVHSAGPTVGLQNRF